MKRTKEPIIRKQCSICLNTMNPKFMYKLSECNHSFHTKCIIGWFRTGKSSCPLCRHSTELNENRTIQQQIFTQFDQNIELELRQFIQNIISGNINYLSITSHILSLISYSIKLKILCSIFICSIFSIIIIPILIVFLTIYQIFKIRHR